MTISKSDKAPVAGSLKQIWYGTAIDYSTIKIIDTISQKNLGALSGWKTHF